MQEKEIINRVAESELVTFNLEDYFPKGERVLFDVKDWLFEGLILKEKDFREFVKKQDWSIFKDKFLALTCTEDAILPTWAYMLVATQLRPFAKKIVFGDLALLETVLFSDAIAAINPKDFEGQKIIIKGCSSVKVPESAYVEIISKLQPVAQSIFYGEACSTVPLFKRK